MPPKSVIRLTLLVIVLLNYEFCDKHYLLSQSIGEPTAGTPQSSGPLQPLPNHTGSGWNAAANRWQLAAIDPRSQSDTVTPDEREKRNAYWTRRLQPVYDLNKRGFGVVYSPGAGFADDPEFPKVEGGGWVIATFENFHVFAIDPEQHLIYTEINLRVDQVLKASKTFRIVAGSEVDIGLDGGRIKSSDGNIVTSSQLTPRRYDYQPGHKYLLLLKRAEKENYYNTYERWDISSGFVKPDTELEKSRVALGRSSIAGMPADNLIGYLQSVLPNADSGSAGGKR